MKAAVIAIAYAAPFAIFALIPRGYEPTFVAIYTTFFLGSLAFPLRKHQQSELLKSGMYKGLAGAVVGVLIIALYLEFLFGLFRQDSTTVVAATWIFFSLIFPTGSALSLCRLGAILKKDGPERLESSNRFPSGAQHFALEYCTRRWFRHGNFLLLSLASFAMYFYGWFLLGFQFLLYSIPLMVFSSFLLTSLSRRFLAPFATSEIARQLEQKDHQAVPTNPTE
jgi:hypothetical protein